MRDTFEQHRSAPRPDILVLLATVTATLELLGQMTAREPEAEGLIRVVRETFGV